MLVPNSSIGQIVEIVRVDSGLFRVRRTDPATGARDFITGRLPLEMATQALNAYAQELDRANFKLAVA